MFSEVRVLIALGEKVAYMKVKSPVLSLTTDPNKGLIKNIMPESLKLFDFHMQSNIILTSTMKSQRNV